MPEIQMLLALVVSIISVGRFVVHDVPALRQWLIGQLRVT